jgi:hypothetical protein
MRQCGHCERAVCSSSTSEELLHRHGIFHLRPGVSTPNDVADHLAARTTARRLPPVAMTVRRTLRHDLDDWEHQVHAWTWPYTADQMRTACADIRAWAVEQAWPLDREVPLERTIQWWAFERTHFTS